VYDVRLRRPACALLQSLMGGTVSNEDLMFLGDWLVNPTPGMQLYRVSREELDALKKLGTTKRNR
jgi:hypothetical protein